MSHHHTILESKSSFLRTQIRLLSAVLQPSSQLREAIQASDGPSQKAVDEVMDKVNAAITTHNRQVYTPETIRHVASQIDALYWNDISARPAPGEKDELMLERDQDLTVSESVNALPDRLADLSPNEENDLSSEDATYADLRNRLLSLTRARDQQQRRLAQYRHVQDLLLSLENPQQNIQPNLPSKDGELARELEKLRVLAARVGKGIAEGGKLEPAGQEEESMDIDSNRSLEGGVEEANRARLARVLQLT